MKKAYSFRAHSLCESTSHELDVTCVFFGDKWPVDETEFFDELEDALKASGTLPDCMAILANEKTIKWLHSLWNKNAEETEGFVSRGIRHSIQYVKGFHFYEWTPEHVQVYKTEAVKGHEFSLPGHELVRGGLRALAKQNPVVQLAPSGHVFKHPSGTVNRVFIQARELAVSEPELAFVGRAIGSQFGAGVLKDAEIVFIDTMSIYPFVKEALSFCGSDAHIQSFHSYGGVEKVSRPTEPYAVVVSASTSGGMVRRLHESQGFDAFRMLTMIDIMADSRLSSILIPLDEVDDIYKPLASDGTETEIELVGEHFASKAKPPRAVTLGTTHRPAHLGLMLKNFGIGGIAPLNHKPEEVSRLKLVCLLSEKVRTSGDFQKWLKEEIQWKLSLSVDHIVHAADHSSKDIASDIAKLIHEIKDNKEAPKVISYADLTSDCLKAAKGVLIVTAISGNGGLLRDISRDLRERLPTGTPRHFLVGVGLPETAEAWKRLVQFLERNATERTYGFSTWLMLPVGSDSEENAWSALAKLAGLAQMQGGPRGGVSNEVAYNSLDQLSTAIEQAAQNFLPRSSGGDLGLSEGFVFFGKTFDGLLDQVIPATTYLTVASVLQAARELNSPVNQLKSTGYESVVLAPENFLRFNDNLLQACVLRAAHPSELDYSASPHLSTLMKEFLLKMFKRHKDGYGASALEFAAALALGRLKLKKADVQEILDKSIPSMASEPSALLGFLLMVEV